MTRRGPSLELAEQVAGRIGLSFPASRKETVASALDRVMVRRGIGEGRLLLDRLGSDEDLTEDVISAVTVGETHFFRGPEQFELIRQTILPELLRRRPEGSPLRIWSIGCATGEEPYSLAILCEEEGLLDGVRIDAADISRRALAAAKAGDYGEWALRNTGPRLRQRYFTSCEGRFRLNEQLRRQVDFAHLNLGTDALPAPEKRLSDFDLILCRNVLVYLEASAVRRIARQLLDCLSDGGWLLTAPTDPPLWKYAPFETSITPAGIVYRRIMAPDTRKSSTACVAPDRRQTGNPVAGVPLARARAAASRKTTGDDTAKAIARQIRSRFDLGEPREAARLAARAIERHPLSAELHFLEGVSRMASGETDAAKAALRRVAYLDGKLAAAQFLLGVCLKDSDPRAALRALENALSSCLSRSPREHVELMPEATAGHLAQRARREIATIRQHLGSEAG
ncbi:protein-glutamate O-methyltransferase CheR [Sinorhizobium meliloti]|uniref:CheR family methyltransferase n=2 Tax=Rhizobium meliloti TaxID=382 RepID=UPI0004F5DB16|nr:protein-glutamate O-methyltransferase CheR [Sinorhizobium meliloti]AIM01883.1 chemotaxis protein CheR [Sinorhizobium meliloti]MDE3822693.1 protein-glutamate O-methyltransferase CheR [Sinorhizobium meliloti]MDW9566823.1 protein-glutamate O-methyltransferase CheR [Sinorhizobium meliloti]MDW9742800.1 protein-glutamate O-methyltransferase CheR [Sinorhizobium meliloti]MDW9761201.1 protein-glutamate O-methyltransferase CheR [Sinorhizobium meliloti]